MEYTVIHGNNRVSQYNSYIGIDRDIKSDFIAVNISGTVSGRGSNPIVWPSTVDIGIQAVVDVKKGVMRFIRPGAPRASTEFVVSTYSDSGSGTVPKQTLKEFTSIEDAPHIFDVVSFWPKSRVIHTGKNNLPEGWMWRWIGDEWVLTNGTIGLVRDDWFKYNNKMVEAQPATSAVTAASMLQSALGHMEDRAKTYDAPGGERSMGKTVSAFNTVTGLTLSEEQGWLFMEILKQVRSQQGNYRADNYEDMVAYAALRGECAARERGE